MRDIFSWDYILWYSRAPGRTPARIPPPQFPAFAVARTPGAPWYPGGVSAGEGFSPARFPAFARVARPQFSANALENLRKNPVNLSNFIGIYRYLQKFPDARTTTPALVLICLDGAHGNHADELHRLARIVVEGVVLAGRHEYGRARRDGLGLALDDHPPLALQHEHLMLPGVGVVGRLPARLDFDDPHRHPGLAVALAQEPADARALGRLLRFQFRVLVVHHLHGVTPPLVGFGLPVPGRETRILPHPIPSVSKPPPGEKGEAALPLKIKRDR